MIKLHLDSNNDYRRNWNQLLVVDDEHNVLDFTGVKKRRDAEMAVNEFNASDSEAKRLDILNRLTGGDDYRHWAALTKKQNGGV